MKAREFQDREICNATPMPKQKAKSARKTYIRSPYREPTHVVRIPESLLPRVRRMLATAKSDVAASAWLDDAQPGRPVPDTQ
jgi:hypothetical protein